MMKMRSNCKMLKEYCGLVKEHAIQQNEERKAKYNIEILRLEAFHLAGYDVYHDILEKIGAKDKHGTFAHPVTDDDAPEYSTTITKPMDLSTMRQKMLDLQYDTLEDLEADFGLMINNCMTYNKKSTSYYKDAVKLMDYGANVFEEARLILEKRSLEEKESKEISEGLGCSLIKTEVEASNDSEVLNNRPLHELLLSILEKLAVYDDEGIFAEPVDLSEVPDYLDIVKEPMDFSTMRNKINSNQYSCVEDFEVDFFLMTSNCLKYNKEKSLFYKCGEMLNVIGRNILEKAKQDQCLAVGSGLTITHTVKTENNNYNYKAVPVSKNEVISKSPAVEKVSEVDLIVDVLKNLISNDVDEIFAEPVSDEDAPEYSTMIKTPMDFSTMQKKLDSSMYSTLEDLEKDFSLIIDNCKRYNSSGTMHFNYAIKMKRAGNSLFNAARKRLAASRPTKECDQSNVD